MADPLGARQYPPRHDIPRGGRSGFVLAEGRQVHYLEWGHGDHAVVCLHGGGQTAYMFEDLGAALAHRYHVVAFDLPDHGDSDPLGGIELDRHRMAATIPGLCAEFGIDRAVFVGASLGGLLSLTLAASFSDLVEGVVVIDVGHRVEEEGVRRIISFLTEHDSFASLEEAAEAVAAYLPHRKAAGARLTRNLRQRSDGRWVWKYQLSRDIGGRSELELLAQAKTFVDGLEEELRSIRCRALILRGAVSDVLSEDGADDLTALIPGARLAQVPGAGHLLAGDNPELFVSLVREFLSEFDW